MNRSLLFTLSFFFISLFAVAQDTMVQAERQATGMRANEKIYVVVAVLGTILAGLFIYIIRLDKKISRLEKSGAS